MVTWLSPNLLFSEGRRESSSSYFCQSGEGRVGGELLVGQRESGHAVLPELGTPAAQVGNHAEAH